MVRKKKDLLDVPFEEIIAFAEDASHHARVLCDLARSRLRVHFSDSDGRLDSGLMRSEQHVAHGLAWFCCYGEALGCMASWARDLHDRGCFTEIEARLLQIYFGEYLNQMSCGISMWQSEIVRPWDIGLDADDLAAFETDSVMHLRFCGSTMASRLRLVRLMREADGALTYGDDGSDDVLREMRGSMRRFVDDRVMPYAHGWHLSNAYVPLEMISELSDLGVFGLTLPEEYGGLGMGKASMCVVSEELSRGWIAVGSLGTRTEIAAELILHGGTDAQKEAWLPRLASGECLSTAVFTEPNTGSDLASLQTRAVFRDGSWYITGNKTWITHPVRADLMTLLARTDPSQSGYKGLSMFLVSKPRGDDENPFPVAGLTGGEIEVLGYRGMKEYELAFDNFCAGENSLLGGVEGAGFKQLMRTFESARIQTAARAVGVGQSALDVSFRYSLERRQFGSFLLEFPRVSDKIALTAAELCGARILTLHAARKKDSGDRCDLEAGMAKLLAARVAWSGADFGVQIHGGNGFALEYEISRILCDARILNIFEGAGEIQAEIIARRLLEGA